MRVQIGVGNAITTVLSVSAKTLTFSGAYNFDIDPSSLYVYNVTRSAFIWWLGTGGTGATVTCAGAVRSTVAGLPVQTLTFSAVPASSADGDSLVIFVDVDDSVATYNAIVTT